MLPWSVCVSAVTEPNQLLEELLWLVGGGAVESMGRCRRCFTVGSVSLPRTSLPRTVPARLCSVDHCTPQLGPELTLVGAPRGVLVVSPPGVSRRDGGRPLPFPFLWVMLLLGLLLFRRGVGWVDKVSVVKVVEEELEELGRGRFILLAVSGAGGDACSSNEGSFWREVWLERWVVGLYFGGADKELYLEKINESEREVLSKGTWSVLKSRKLEEG